MSDEQIEYAERVAYFFLAGTATFLIIGGYHVSRS